MASASLSCAKADEIVPFRPISLISIIGKLFEGITINRLEAIRTSGVKSRPIRLPL